MIGLLLDIISYLWDQWFDSLFKVDWHKPLSN